MGIFFIMNFERFFMKTMKTNFSSNKVVQKQTTDEINNKSKYFPNELWITEDKNLHYKYHTCKKWHERRQCHLSNAKVISRSKLIFIGFYHEIKKISYLL